MTNTFDKGSLELARGHQETPKNLRVALAHDLFQGATVDVFVGQEHYRIVNCHAWLDPKRLVFNPFVKTHGVFHFVQSQWMPSVRRAFPLQFREGARNLLMHGSDNKLILFAFMEGTSDDETARVVLYPQGREPTQRSKSIVGWLDAVNPLLNGDFRPYVIS